MSSTISARGTRELLVAITVAAALGCSGSGSGSRGPDAEAVPDGLLRGVIDIEVGGSFACARLEDGSVTCWGSRSTEPWLSGTDGVRALALMSQTSCAILEDDQVRCAGYNLHEQASGDGLTDADRLWAGASEACIKRKDGSIWCWGAGAQPAPIDLPSDVTELAMGANVACALRAGGMLHCWGAGTTGAFGDAWSPDTAVPAEVPGVSGVSMVVAAHQHICVNTTDAQVLCAGYDFPAMLSPVTGLEPVLQMDGGGWGACALVDGGRVQCWGRNMHGQLGDGSTKDSTSAAVTVEGISDAIEVGVGFNFACALLADTTVRCWGRNGDGALGDGTTTDRPLPVPVLAPD